MRKNNNNNEKSGEKREEEVQAQKKLQNDLNPLILNVGRYSEQEEEDVKEK
jgi:hypothetical protein